MKIRYYAPNSTMGDTSNDDCKKFREWAKSQIEGKYPNHDVQVMNCERMVTVDTDDFDNGNEIIDFCSSLWDDCPWDFE